jgi:hypothetical protein
MGAVAPETCLPPLRTGPVRRTSGLPEFDCPTNVMGCLTHW